jgi:hypothetical protein
MFNVLIVQAAHDLSDEHTEFLSKDRRSFMRSLGLGLGDRVPDPNTIWTFREALARVQVGGTPAIQVLFVAYEAALAKAGFLAGGGQIIVATSVAAPKQRSTDGEKVSDIGVFFEGKRRSQAALVKRIKEIAETRVRYGYRRVHVLLKREGWVVNAKRIYRLDKELGLQLRNKAPKRRVRTVSANASRSHSGPCGHPRAEPLAACWATKAG